MNTNDVTNWDLAYHRARASRERALAYRELKAQFSAWLHRTAQHGVSHKGSRECLDAGG